MQNQKILLLSADQKLLEAIPVFASRRALKIDSYNSMANLGSLSLLSNYDLIIADYKLEVLTGNEIAQYVDVFFKSIPVYILYDDVTLPSKDIAWAACVKGVIEKTADYESILTKIVGFAAKA